MEREVLKLALETAYLSGFNASGEGYNGEYGINCPEENAIWKRDRDNDLAAINKALAQPAQEPWPDLTKRDRELYQKWHNDGVAHHKQAVKAAQPAQRKPLTINEITAIEEKVYMQTTHKGKPAFEYAHALIRAVEAAHDIKEKNNGT
jgi:hypothetical protein